MASWATTLIRWWLWWSWRRRRKKRTPTLAALTSRSRRSKSPSSCRWLTRSIMRRWAFVRPRASFCMVHLEQVNTGQAVWQCQCSVFYFLFLRENAVGKGGGQSNFSYLFESCGIRADSEIFGKVFLWNQDYIEVDNNGWCIS